MHFDVEYQPTFPVGGWDGIVFFLNGWAGVDLFFILSGFLITFILLKRKREKALSFKRYLLKRFLRIAPSYYFVLFMVALGLLPFYQRPVQDWWFRVAYHVAFLQDYLPANFVVAFWSLGVEEKFYLLMPFLMMALSSQQPAAGLSPHPESYLYSTDAQAVGFLSVASPTEPYDLFFLAS